jgi:hypothetical protein
MLAKNLTGILDYSTGNTLGNLNSYLICPQIIKTKTSQNQDRSQLKKTCQFLIYDCHCEFILIGNIY